ncbi:phage portal protein [Clostridium perfringens]|nr:MULTISPECIES: phage portal protein [Clostridium]MDK7589839.1 phage portal protein [Clostridium sp. UMB9555B]MDK7627767.1 phage portal protein [Clostridium sp. UMB9555A]MDM0609609.1 phage portal protein [Clostridium perfringens]HBC2029780.1 phage portal protein [Clostridium perfringens]HBC2032857.1 phage portal protein [Clostridium perfringens]
MGFFKNMINKYRNYVYAKMLSGETPIFSQFGEDIYASDIVKNCIRCTADEMSKLKPKHIRILAEDKQQTINSSINRLLKVSPNPLMTISEFLEKCVWLRETTYNCFIYPQFYINDSGKRIYTGFYPLNPRNVDFLEDESGTLFIKFTFGNGMEVTLKYSNIIHWRKDFSFNEFMGGNAQGQADNRELLKILNINNTITEGLDKAVKSSLTINGIVKINTLLDDENQQKERAKFERQLQTSQSGILALDMKSDFISLSRNNPVVIDKNILEFVEAKILNRYGVSFPILTGDFTDEQYQAFYDKKLEPMINSLGQAFNKCLFTDREIDMGNEVIFYPQKLLFTNTKNKIAVGDILGNRGALTDNQLLELFGYPPFEGGDIRHMSLNYINRDLADSYQAQKAGKGVKEDE